MKLRWFSLMMIIFLTMPVRMVQAQDSIPPGPVYVVKAGDTIWSISLMLGMSVDELILYNNITDPNLLKIGDRLIIPNLEDVQGEISIVKVPFGETQRSLSRKYQLTEHMLIRLNHQVSPMSFYAGSNLVLIANPDDTVLSRRGRLAGGMSLMELAVLQGTDAWQLVSHNRLKGRWDGLPGDILVISGEDEPGPGGLPPEFKSVELTPLPVVQGKTSMIRVAASASVSLSGSLAGYELHFFTEGSERYIALQGIHAMKVPGLYPVSLRGVMPDGSSFDFSQMVYLAEGAYIYDPTLYVDPATLNPEVTRPEDAEWTALASPVTDEKLWSGQFTSPVAPEFSDCFPSRFGNRRSYNDSPYDFFHTGLDFCGAVGNAIFAPADGLVVFAGPLSVRGNATMINHGWGIYTGYMHQSEFLIQVGDRVEAGQQIGLVGATGRVTGAHLHWEVWSGGVQVEPLDWLQTVYP